MTATGRRLRVLLERGRYERLLALAASVPNGSPERATALLWSLRCRMDQGCVGPAMAIAGDLSAEALDDGHAGAHLRLWTRYLTLTASNGPSLAAAATELDKACADASSAPGPGRGRRHLTAKALATDLRARADSHLATLRGELPRRRADLVRSLAGASAAYRSAGLFGEALAALRRAAVLSAEGPGRDPERARALLQQARREARERRLVLPDAEASLALADIDLADALAGRGDPPSVLAVFGDVAARFAQSRHAFGRARVDSAIGRRLLEYGDARGLDQTRAAAVALRSAGATAAARDAWEAVATWCAAHGDLEGLDQARREVGHLVELLGFGLADSVGTLVAADQATRAGDVGRARGILLHSTPESAAGDGLVAQRQLMLATAAQAVGMTAEAMGLLDEARAELEERGADILLGEVLQQLALLVFEQDPAHADRLMARAVDAAGGCGERIDESRYGSLRAWLRVRARRGAGCSPPIDEDAGALFDAAEAILVPLRTVKATEALVDMLQLRGQAALLGADWPECHHHLARAEEVARAHGLLPRLAFTLAYHGMVLVDMGRREGPFRSDQAAARLDEALDLFARIGPRPFLWRLQLFRALCDLEPARRWGLPAPERDERRRQGEWFLEAAVQEIDSLRGSSDDGPAQRRQDVRMAFGVDKRSVYEEGFRLAWDDRRDPVAGLCWLERMKGRALLDALAGEAAPEAELGQELLVARERALRTQIAPAHDGAAAEAIRREIDGLLDELARNPRTAGYAALRRSQPPAWDDLRRLLVREHEASAGGSRPGAAVKAAA